MGGSVKIESDGLGTGTTFVITIQGISLVNESIIKELKIKKEEDDLNQSFFDSENQKIKIPDNNLYDYIQNSNKSIISNQRCELQIRHFNNE